MSTITLGLPSKGRLQHATIEWLGAHGIVITRADDSRKYTADVTGLAGIEAAMLSAGEIPRALETGSIHIGVTGEDLIRERIHQSEKHTRLLAPMGFGFADLVVAVPAGWVDVETMADLDDVAHRFRLRHGMPLRIATKYHNLARRFFQRHGIADYRLVDSQGATEATPTNLTAEGIVDITSSGETLRANHLKILNDGLILRSQACLWCAQNADWTEENRAVLAALETRLGLG